MLFFHFEYSTVSTYEGTRQPYSWEAHRILWFINLVESIKRIEKGKYRKLSDFGNYNSYTKSGSNFGISRQSRQANKNLAVLGETNNQTDTEMWNKC